MICKIADLIAEVPAAGGLAPRCQDYLWSPDVPADIVIREADYRWDRYDARYPESTVAYMESAYQFYKELTRFDGFYLHCSAVVLDGKAYLFSGHSGAGKSTHTKLWQQIFGQNARVINDDKPALRRIDGVWYAYGTPWCGKDGININEKAPIAGVCFLVKAKHNCIRRLSVQESLQKILAQTIYKFKSEENLDLFLSNMERFLQEIPVFELENLPQPEAAKLSYQTMCPKELEKRNEIEK